MTLGKIFHIIHMTDDYDALEAWYKDVFAVVGGWRDKNYIESEKRIASLQVLADVCIEPLAPAFDVEGADTMPLGRFYSRFGQHWHSIAWYADDTLAVRQAAIDAGIRVLGLSGSSSEAALNPRSPVITHPKDTFTQLEFFNPKGVYDDKDPRLAPEQTGFDPAWWVKNHPVKTPGLAYATIIADDLDRAVTVYTGLGGRELYRDSSALTGTDNVYMQLGEAALQFSTPTKDGTLAAADREKNGESFHSVAFRVLDLDDTEAYFDTKGIKTLARDETTLLTDPATTFGVPFRWTTWDVPGGPRDN